MNMNPKALWRLTVKDEFCAAHALRHYKGKCENLHGHNYSVDVVVQGRKLLPGTELLMDFGDLKALLKGVLKPLDHAMINDVPPFDQINPSSENLASYIWQQCAGRLPEGVSMYQVTVAEKGRQSATYMES